MSVRLLVRALAAAGGGPITMAQLAETPMAFDSMGNAWTTRKAERLGLVQGRPTPRGRALCDDPALRQVPLQRARGLAIAWKLTPLGWELARGAVQLKVRPYAEALAGSRIGGRPAGANERVVATWLRALPIGVRLAPTGCAPGAIELAPDDPRLAGLPDGALVVIRRRAAAES